MLAWVCACTLACGCACVQGCVSCACARMCSVMRPRQSKLAAQADVDCQLFLCCCFSSCYSAAFLPGSHPCWLVHLTDRFSTNWESTAQQDLHRRSFCVTAHLELAGALDFGFTRTCVPACLPYWHSVHKRRTILPRPRKPACAASPVFQGSVFCVHHRPL